MKRLTVDQEVSLSVGDVTIDCHVASVAGGEAALAPQHPDDLNLLPAASAGASIVFTHGGGGVAIAGAHAVLRHIDFGRIWRSTGDGWAANARHAGLSRSRLTRRARLAISGKLLSRHLSGLLD